MAVSIPAPRTGRRAASVTPDFADYDWYGRRVRINLKRCHVAMCQKILDIEFVGGKKLSVSLAENLKVSHETLRRFFRGHQIDPTSLNLILKGLGLKGEQVIEEVA